MNVVVSYRNGVKMAYSLNAFNPWEGYVVSFNGTQGRIEHKCEESVYINADGSVPGALVAEGTWTRIYPHWKPAYEVEMHRCLTSCSIPTRPRTSTSAAQINGRAPGRS